MLPRLGSQLSPFFRINPTFPALKALDLLARLRYLLKLKKLEIATPMVGKTDDVMQCAWNSMLKKWHNAKWGERGYFIGETPDSGSKQH